LVALPSFATACRDRPSTPAPSNAAVVSPGAPVAQEAAGLPEAVASDGDVPGYLPPRAVGGVWNMSEPVQSFANAAQYSVIDAAEAARIGGFRITGIYRCAYRRAGNDGSPLVAEVVAFDTESSSDAYGLLTCHSSSTERLDICGEARVERHDGFHLHGWQGKSYVRLDSVSADSDMTEQMIQLLDAICSRIAGEGRPPLVNAIPEADGGPRDLWLARDTTGLPVRVFDFPSAPSPAVINGLLGLDNTTLLAVAHYDVPAGRGPNVIWLVQYPNQRAAYQAHGRYTDYLKKHDDPAAQSTNLLPSHGAILAGTWTAEEESLQYVLPPLSRNLPMGS
jgi:hypothetical protein